MGPTSIMSSMVTSLKSLKKKALDVLAKHGAGAGKSGLMKADYAMIEELSQAFTSVVSTTNGLKKLSPYCKFLMRWKDAATAATPTSYTSSLNAYSEAPSEEAAPVDTPATTTTDESDLFTFDVVDKMRALSGLKKESSVGPGS